MTIHIEVPFLTNLHLFDDHFKAHRSSLNASKLNFPKKSLLSRLRSCLVLERILRFSAVQLSNFTAPDSTH